MPYDPAICFDFPEEAAAYIDKLEAENARLKAQIESAAKQEPVAIVRVRPLQSDECRAKIDVEWLSNPLNNCNLYARPQPAIPEGWKLVPSTVQYCQFEAMWDALTTQERFERTRAVLSVSELSEIFSMVSHTMLKAAPTPEGK